MTKLLSSAELHGYLELPLSHVSMAGGMGLGTN